MLNIKFVYLILFGTAYQLMQKTGRAQWSQSDDKVLRVLGYDYSIQHEGEKESGGGSHHLQITQNCRRTMKVETLQAAVKFIHDLTVIGITQEIQGPGYLDYHMQWRQLTSGRQKVDRASSEIEGS